MRDPRVDPQAGDVLAKGHVVRCVCGEGISLIVSWNEAVLPLPGPMMERKAATIESWRDWARNAHVLLASPSPKVPRPMPKPDPSSWDHVDKY